MRFSSLLIGSFLLLAICLTSKQLQAKDLTAAKGVLTTSITDPTPMASTEKVVLAGKITNLAGPLPGAVVVLTGTKQMAVTNAEGEFEFTVPANSGALAAVVTYAGYADERMILNASAEELTVSLTNARVIVVSRKNQLKKYLKTAHKQVKRDLKQVRKG